MSHIFISYSKQDIDFMRYLRALLEKEGFRVWVDEARLTPSVRWWKTIEENIESCSAFLVIMSPHGYESDWVEREILLAEGRKRPIFPVLLAGDPWSRLANIQYEDMRAGLQARLSPHFASSLGRVVKPRPALAERRITFTIEWGDITEISADVIALKFAQNFYGADAKVAERLVTMTKPDYVLRNFKLPSGESLFLKTEGAVAAPNVLFVGTPRLHKLDYHEIRTFARQTLISLREKAPETRHLAMTIHGPGFGRDELEALRSQFEGYRDALHADELPPALDRITIVEFSEGRVTRLRAALEEELAHNADARRLEAGWGYELTVGAAPAAPETTAAPAKPHAFVIMPLVSDLDDIFFYGIQAPVHALGLLCERIEAESMTAELLEQVRDRIAKAAVVVAEITQPDPAVWLQLGFAWGKDRPTVILANNLANNGTAPPFDIPGMLNYKRIKDCEELLSQALSSLKAEGAL